QGTEWDHEKIYGTIASGKSVQANLATPIPVYIVYFTVAATPDAPGYYSYKDMYGRDKPALAGLENLPIPKAPQAEEESTTASAKPAKAKAPVTAARAAKPVKPAGASAARQAALTAAVVHPSTR